MSLGFSLYRRVIHISNELPKLIPIGTLHFYNLPLHRSDLGGIPCEIDPSLDSVQTNTNIWKWLDIDQLIFLCENNSNSILADIQFLMIYRYIMATYKIIRWGPMVIAKVRIFAVPEDIDGSQYFKEWRSSRPRHSSIEKKFREKWHTLISHIDFSSESWDGLKLDSLLLIPCLQIHLPLTLKTTDLGFESDPKFHIERWYNSRPFGINIAGTSDTAVQKVSAAYNNIPSPDISKYYTKSKSVSSSNIIPSAEEVIVNLVHNMSEGNNSIPGVKTQLYPFQIKSLSKMYERESFPEKTVIPNFIELNSASSGLKYYFDIINTKFFWNPEVFSQPRGGILAENMGLGKTLICLSLICLTKWELSTLPHDTLTILPEEQVPHETTFHHLKTARFKKLADLCKECITRNSLPWKFYKDDLPESVITKLKQSPGSFRIPLENSSYVSPFSIQRSRRSERLKDLDQELPLEGRSFRTLYFCNTTLIVVPDNLFHQWNTELRKHIQPHFLRKLFISNQFKKLLVSENGVFTNEVYEDPIQLIQFDLIVISNSILSKQFDERDDTPLMKIFWKRLIIDEGHSMTSKVSRAGLLCREMNVERRWAVTGTPTSGLTRLHMDEEDEEGKSLEDSPSKRKSKYVVKNSFNEIDDLMKLGNIVSNFLKIEPFHSQPRLWKTLMINPLLLNLYGSTTSLSNLLDAIVVRHSLDEVERDIKLPQLHHVSVFLKPSFLNKLSINIFTAVLAVNAVSSERKDIDYMFHPSNRQQLRRLITNLQRATFHWSGFKQEDVEALIHVCKVCLEKKGPDRSWAYSPADRALLKKSRDIAQLALDNPRWRTMSLLHEMNFFIDGLPDIFTKTFGIGVLKSTNAEGVENDIGVFGAPHLHCLQEFFYKNRFMNMNDGDTLLEKLDAVSKPFWSNYWEDTMKKNNQKFNKPDKKEEAEPASAPSTPKKRRNSLSNASKPKSSKPKEAQNSKSELEREDGEGLKITNEVNTLHSLAKHNISYESIKNSIILGTASAKLSYLSSKLLENQQKKIKSIVFFEFEDSAYYLTELLDILGVNYILYATFINTTHRAENLSEFSNYNSEDNGGITLLMDLRLAAHGLTIIAATNVYFISPVWQRSVEAQAIKRAHRIGQTKEVHVETLVLEDTLEEEIYKRRLSQQEEKNDGENKKRYVIDDTGMQDFILRHRFLPMDSETEYAPFSAPTNSPRSFVTRQELDDPSGLNQHEDTVVDVNGIMTRNWKVFAFNSDNLSKLNSLKNQKITKEYMKDQFIKNMASEQDAQEVEAPKVKKERPARKSVRF
ncbi:hypothetical protein CANTEDRAFT_131662 [Yamadazyma tenuis ATCC 10573]|uniref:Helicase C-terminal domain-containing protein n=1 Tax=Candida tenuis (strain ATCC 10573 / BCRC 21748 / CBS 615 / JCM 9827 / NBRC 10315 / NRRL Y-1498 / VKM Y-70) TaxID=590646 RepID=G3B7R0_CANTC|nr:uncharacterized protein CANTEDRAFT_131662 [Yamadazyma tenuis ATCC 10573]EGV62298.1 hypothetical protein CANTEDRAFT_131662 [Yamadazyma tenuis ATCC 10573]